MSTAPTLHAQTVEAVSKMLQPDPPARHADYNRLLDHLHIALSDLNPPPDAADPHQGSIDDLDKALQHTPRSRQHGSRRKKKRSTAHVIRILITLLAVVIGLICLVSLLLWGVSVRV